MKLHMYKLFLWYCSATVWAVYAGSLFLVILIYIMSIFKGDISDFRCLALQHEDFTEVGSIFGILLLDCINTGISMNLFLLYFGVLYYILHFMILDFFVLITLQYRTGGPRPASKLRSLFYVCTLHCVLQSLLIIHY